MRFDVFNDFVCFSMVLNSVTILAHGQTAGQRMRWRGWRALACVWAGCAGPLVGVLVYGSLRGGPGWPGIMTASTFEAVLTRARHALWDEGRFKIIISTYQIVSMINDNLGIYWPEPFATLEKAMGFTQLSLGLLPLGCVGDFDFYDTLRFAVWVPIGVFALVWLAGHEPEHDSRANWLPHAARAAVQRARGHAPGAERAARRIGDHHVLHNVAKVQTAAGGLQQALGRKPVGRREAARAAGVFRSCNTHDVCRERKD